ncbi:MAG: hypothetical protein ACJ74M_00080 [Gaiellaceae bacterium]
MARVIAYKFLAPGSVGPFTGYNWEPDRWVEAESPDVCRRGIHACRTRDLPIWLDEELWEIELAGDVVEQARKLVASSGRLTRRIEAWTPALAQRFGAFCARRTRTRVGHLPHLSGFVADVERFVAARRIPIAGFGAARAAELEGGPAAYEAERMAQAAWLAHELGLPQ